MHLKDSKKDENDLINLNASTLQNNFHYYGLIFYIIENY